MPGLTDSDGRSAKGVDDLLHGPYSESLLLELFGSSPPDSSNTDTVRSCPLGLGGLLDGSARDADDGVGVACLVEQLARDRVGQVRLADVHAR